MAYVAFPLPLEKPYRMNAGDHGRYERLTAVNGDPYFTLTAANGQVIGKSGKSEMYSSAAAMKNGIASVKTNGPDAPIVEAKAN